MKDEIDLLLENLKSNNLKTQGEIKNDLSLKIELDEDFLITNVKNYNDVCNYLKEPLELLPYLQIKQIERLFNGSWVKNFSIDQNNYYPYFTYDKTSGYLVFFGSRSGSSGSAGQVAFYKNEKISDYVGETFIDIYNKL